MPPKKRVTRTTVQLKAETKTIAYEFAQLCTSADLLRQNIFGGAGVSHNNTVQGFATALRNLSCFFFPHQAGFPELDKDDLGAEEYVPDWPKRAPVPSKLLRNSKDAANKEIMHITGTRRDLNFVVGNQHNWALDDLEQELLEALRIFLAATSDAQFDPLALADLRQVSARTPISPSGVISNSGHVSVGVPVTRTTAYTTDVRTISPHPSFCAKTSR